MSNTLENDRGRTWRLACAAALAGLSGMAPSRLSLMLADMPPEVAWDMLGSGERFPFRPGTPPPKFVEPLMQKWCLEVRKTDPLEVLEKYSSLGISIWCQLEEYPQRLLNDPAPPAVLFWQGHEAALSRPRVALLGTRRATHAGREIARRLGAELAEAGVCVLSGLALGIDGAAHQGALEVPYGARPIAVVGNGLDGVYPKRNAQLWSDIRESGLLISEAPLGALPEPWRFPARNRIIAGLADLVVVVESHETGGSLLTVNEALDRAVPVFAVPGSVNSPASRGTNNLLRDGAGVVCSTQDILMALSLEPCLSEPEEFDAYPVNEVDGAVLHAIDWAPTTLDEILLRTGRSPGEVAVALIRLTSAGIVVGHEGCWQRQDQGSAGADPE